jgi:hypothetical protein
MLKRSYAIWWHEGDGPKHAGKLELGRLHMSVGYASGELMVTRRGGSPLRIGSLDALGALREVSDALALMPSRLLPSAGP